MAKREAPKDMFMQFAAIKGNIDPTSSDNLSESVINTGLSIRGALLWLVHGIEFDPEVEDYFLTGLINRIDMAVSTKKGLAAMPNWDDDGCVAKCSVGYSTDLGVGNNATIILPVRIPFLPPVPIAAPSLHLYTQMLVDQVGARGDDVFARILFTTAPLDEKTYVEVAEAWGW